MSEHHPVDFANSLSTKLASRSRHVCVFLGAGAATSCGLPDVSQLEDDIQSGLDDEFSEKFERQLEGGTLEQVLSRLRKIATLVDDGQSLDDLAEEDAKKLDEAVCQEIINALDLNSADLSPMEKFASWVARANYERPIEVFTVNYDLLLESAFEEIGVPYFDGFVGNIEARFQSDLVEQTAEARGDEIPSYFARLWKVHGSVNWSKKDNQVVRMGSPVDTNSAAAIYPSDTKYDKSRRVPFVVLQDRLRRVLHEDETIVIISGYSFGDDHLNEMIFNAATRLERSEFIVFCYSNIPDVVAENAQKTPNLQVAGPKEAILSGVPGEWEPPDDAPNDVWEEEKLALRDFRHLASYLARSSTHKGEIAQDFSQVEEPDMSKDGYYDG